MQELRDRGYLPAAVRNYLALLGWGTDDDTTLMSTDELVARFSLERVGRAAAVFDERKLRWVNGRFMRALSLEEYERRLRETLEREDAEAAGAFAAAGPELRRAACRVVRDKAQTLVEAWPLVRFLFAPPVDDQRAWEKVMTADSRAFLSQALSALGAAEPFDAATIEAVLSPLPEHAGIKPKALYQPIRVAITGTTISPGIFDSLAALGRERSLARLENAIARLDPAPGD